MKPSVVRENTANGRILLVGIGDFGCNRVNKMVKSSGWFLACTVSMCILYNCSEVGIIAGLQSVEMGFLTPLCTEVWSSGGLPRPGTMHMCVLCSHFTWLDPFWASNSWWLRMSVQRNWIKFRHNMLVRHPSTTLNLALYDTALDKELKLINGGVVIWQNIPNRDCLYFLFLILINPV